jgi:hypothetical protein
MTETEYARKLDELDRLLNDPDVPMQPSLVWSLLAEISRHDLPGSGLSGLPPAPTARRQ